MAAKGAGAAYPEVTPQRLGIGRLFDQVHDAIIVADADGRIVLWNGAAQEMFGYTAEEIAERGLHAIVPPRLRPQHDAGMARFRHSGSGPVLDTGQVLSLPALRKDGREIAVEMTLSTVRDGDAPGTFVLAIVRDVTARALLERERRLLDLVAHELNTPLTPLLLQLELLRAMPEGEVGPKARHALDILDRGLHRLADLVQDLLDVARLEAGQFTLRLDRVDLGPLVEAAVRTVAPQAEAAGVALAYDVADAPEAVVDAARVGQVVGHLLTNAVRSTPRGGSVAVEVVRADDRAVLRVRDSGVGLTTEQLGRLFQPFEQVHGHDPSGAGLGLYLSRGIVGAHGGRLWAVSDGPGQGSTFSVALPLERRKE